MALLNADSDMDWMKCELIESVPGKVSGRPIVRGTRILPDPIVNSYELGDTLKEIHEGLHLLVTGDRTLHHEQNLSGRRIAIVALSAIEWHLVEPCLRGSRLPSISLSWVVSEHRLRQFQP